MHNSSSCSNQLATDVVSVNGSSITGQCSSFTKRRGNCTDPTSSVLFDGHILTLAGPDSNMWASQLLTLMPTGGTTEITFDFGGNPNLMRVEVVMFNCPQWGTGIQRILVRENMIAIANVETFAITLCDYLIRTCIMATLYSPNISLRFALSSFWVHLAEVTFHTDTSGCFLGTTVMGATPPTSATSSFGEITTAAETQTTFLAMIATTTSQPVKTQAETATSSECVPIME